jgi:rare lipoprotein A
MRPFRYHRQALAATLFAGAAAALTGCQQPVSVSPTDAPPAEATPAFRAIEIQQASSVSAESVPAAVQTGSFEEPYVQPTSVPTATPAPVTAAPARSTVVTTMATELPQKSATAVSAETSEPEQEIASFAPAKALLFESGIASTYGNGDGFEGMRTGCGGIFHTGIVQVAHKTLPCGTVVRIEDTHTGKTVDAEVTDRGPYVPGRIVDLSLAAFTQLDPSGTGLLHVNVYVLDTSHQYVYRLS